ncbi:MULTISPECIES: glycosyltransferase family 2 protein [unclassified Pasteurella]|uniref:glycosyltransferase family 2 protein n=1 Tax=unclassified Pasteurella TaxID=2621516 RepID=UPI00107452B7|nr:glycosyltransferase family 2 protein [Pasteurella sp. 19428wF3_WM03]TFU49976.1 glycosyltransferase family 2 protein [Pasteurella sp. WM03]
MFFKKKKLNIQQLAMSNLSIELQADLLCQQNLYYSILNNTKLSDSYAYIIALAATGKKIEAIQQLTQFEKKTDFEKYRLKLLKGLLPFLPHISFSLLDSHILKKEKLLVTSLLSFLNKKNDLAPILQNLSLEDKKKQPEFFLIENHADLKPHEKLNNINLYLGVHSLLPINLINSEKCLYINNIRSEKIKNFENNKALPLVSILVTVYNREKLIKNCLLSLIYQSYENKEIIVIDDASSDNSVNIIKELAQVYSQIKLIELKNNVGTFIAKNIGAKSAVGEFITCHDSDDWAHPQKLEKQITPLLNKPNLIATFSKWIRLTETGSPYSRFISPITRLNPSSALFRRELVEQSMGLWDCVRTGADSEFNQRLKLNFPNRTLNVNLPLTLGSHHPDSLMNTEETGYISGVSTQRLEYWETWNKWHIQCLKENKLPKLPVFDIYTIKNR